MAKGKMLCPFSGKLCRECPQYRGRHYYLCFCDGYRGYLGEHRGKEEKKSWSRGPDMNYEMPLHIPPSPKRLVLNEFAERKRKR